MSERPEQPGESTENSMPLPAHSGWILALASMVVTWQVLALVMPLSGATPPGTLLRWGLALLGFFFVATGVWAWFLMPGRTTLLFTLYALCGGLHWGGPVAVAETARDGMIAMAERLGISSLTGEQYGLALTLGGGEVSLLDMTSAYSVFANGGKKLPPVAILKIVDFAGNIIYTVAAYNAGPQAVNGWIAKHGRREPDEFVELIPYQETRLYVKRVLRSYREYQRLRQAQAQGQGV